MIFPNRPAGRHQSLARRVLTLAAAALLSVFLLPAVAAQADTASSLTIVGTSDVSDSGLMQNLIQPQFQAAFPQYTPFKYVGTATGTAITDAETGVQTPSVLIVHAASLENQFVAGGFSYEQFGRAIFTNDFVLGGPSGGSDPAGVAANASHNIVQAFADIAAAGFNGGGTPKVTFVSRGGTPGTTVEEHQIWALVGAMATPPAGLNLCTVSAASGGGMTPVSAASGLGGQPCGGTGLPPASALPSWYATTGLTQGPNVIAADACTGFASTGNSCYVLTDRGTFDYLASGQDPAGSISHLAILTRGPQDAAAPGGPNLLVNYFHAYIINPAQCTACGVNLPAAQAFVNFLTSPGFQAQLKTYLASTDPAGPPFVADASPNLTAAGFPSSATGGAPVTVTGTLTNAEPGYPALAGKTVSVDEIVAGLPVAVASGTTDTNGGYSISFKPTSTGSYQVSTNQIAQIEVGTLSPPFGDLLSPAATAAVSLSVLSTVSITKAKPSPGRITVTGTVAPAAADAKATVAILARRRGSKAAFKQIGVTSLAAGQSSYRATGSLKVGRWQVEAKFQDGGQVLAATSPAVNVKVSPPAVAFGKLTVKNGKLKVTGTVNPAPTASRARVVLSAVARSGAVTFKVNAKGSVTKGKTKFTIHAQLKRGFRWVLRLEYLQKGQSLGFSKPRSIDVH